MGLAAIGGVIATFLFESIEGEERRWASIGFMIIIFIISVIIGKGMKIGLPSSDRKKLVTTGIGSFVFIYLFMWILSYTLTHHPDTGIIPLNPL
jgi:cell division protein FtsW (lipid II flippase)